MKINNSTLPKYEECPDNDIAYFIKFTRKLNKISCVIFSLYAAKLIKTSESLVTNCLDLIEKWLQAPNSVNPTELNNIADTAEKFVEDHPVDVTDNWYAAATASNAARTAYYNDTNIAGSAASAADWSAHGDIIVINKLLYYLGYLLPKEPELNNFNIDLLKQNNPQAYSFLEKISKLEDRQVTNDDLFGIRQVFDVLEEVGAPLDPNEFKWAGEGSVYNEIIEKHKLLQAIRREF